jgi:hypothetical protein
MTREKLKPTREKWCKHFNGIQSKTCKVGIAYDSVKDTSSTPFRWICNDLNSPVPCGCHELYTAEELEQQAKELGQRLDNMLKAMSMIREINGKRRGVTGTIECPACQGKLHYSISSYNGHVHGKCEKAGCVNWMQ